MSKSSESKDRSWRDYPIGTKAHSFLGGYWIKVPLGWKWHCGSTFPTPGGEAIGKCVELPIKTIFGVEFTGKQEAALSADARSPRWDLHPPQREEYEDDHLYAIGLRDYADRLVACLPAR